MKTPCFTRVTVQDGFCSASLLPLGAGVYLPLCSKFNISRADMARRPWLIVACARMHTATSTR